MHRLASLTGIGLLASLMVAGPVLAQHPGNRGGGPPFCRSGQGHPVHGWGWCVAKGWAPAPAYAHPVPVRGWEVILWDDAYFRHDRPVRHDRWLDRREMAHLLGRDVVVRLEAHSGRRGHRGALRGRWVQERGFDGFALQVVVGSTPVAYLHDLYRDGRVDRVYFRPR
jgi:hypothetical protein